MENVGMANAREMGQEADARPGEEEGDDGQHPMRHVIE
jgi:hypothetical protein